MLADFLAMAPPIARLPDGMERVDQGIRDRRASLQKGLEALAYYPSLRARSRALREQAVALRMQAKAIRAWCEQTQRRLGRQRLAR